MGPAGGAILVHSVLGACPRSPREGPARAAAWSLAVQLQVLEVRGPDDLVRVFRLANEERAGALHVLASPLLASL